MDLTLFMNACREGHKDLVLLLIEKGADNWDWGLAHACQGGHKDLVLLMIEKGANNWDWGLRCACSGGHKDLAILMIEKGANDLGRGLYYACYSRHKDLAILMIEKGAYIQYCYLELNEFDIDYLLETKKISNFGKYQDVAKLCQARRDLTNDIMIELKMRDVNRVIYLY